MKRAIFIFIASCILLPLSAASYNTANLDNTAGVDRYAVYVGSNDGGKERERLLYAGSDAQSFQKIMSEIGGVQDSNSYVLIDPSKEKIDDTLAKISTKINLNKSNAKRSEFIFYYSGHSDENSLLLGEASYDYSSLKQSITQIPSDIHIVILDSCYSGNFIRTKGGQKRKPFLMDDTSVVKGHAYLSSSSDHEYSQESDDIESSYFTNAMITGLRGAADTSGDNKVTLNELYSYAFNDTLSKTESSKAGPQHPNYNITLVGSGDLILSDISTADAMLSLSKDAKGTFIIRDNSGKLVSEINKTPGQPIFMALPVGTYSAVSIDEYSTKQGFFTLEKDSVYVLDMNNMTAIKKKDTRLRGGSIDENESQGLLNEASIADAVHINIIPGIALLRFSPDCSLASFGIIGGSERNMTGLQASSVMNINTGNLTGVQGAGVFNINNGNVLGAQFAGVFNTAQNVNGIQGAGVFNVNKSFSGAELAGVFNISSKEQSNGVQGAGVFNICRGISGVQGAGVFNVCDDIEGVQAAGVINVAKKVSGLQIGVINVATENNGLAIGVLNFIGNGMHHAGFVWNSSDKMFDAFFQSGTKKLFATIGMSFSDKAIKGETIDKCLLYSGLGTEFIFSKSTFLGSSVDIEGLVKNVFPTPALVNGLSGDLSAYISVEENNLHISISPTFESPDQYMIPSLRITFNSNLGKHLEATMGWNFDLNVAGWNDKAFELFPHANNFAFGSNDEWKFYYSWFVGFKIK